MHGYMIARSAHSCLYIDVLKWQMLAGLAQLSALPMPALPQKRRGRIQAVHVPRKMPWQTAEGE